MSVTTLTEKQTVLNYLKKRRGWVYADDIQTNVGLGSDRRARELRQEGLAESKREGRQVLFRYLAPTKS